MPWQASDAIGHTKKADTPAKQKKWAEIANKVLEESGDEGKAIEVANNAIAQRSADFNGWFPGMTETRLASIAPKTFSKSDRTVDAVLSRGSPVERFYGTESLRITKDAVILDRLKQGGIPMLDSHRQDSITSALGRVREAWIDRGPSLMGRLAFNETEYGERAMGMVSRGEISAVSAGYAVREWEIKDSEGRVIDPEKERLRWDEKLSFEATRWEVLEASLCAVPADASAVIRKIDTAFTVNSIFDSAEGPRHSVSAIRARMLARQHIVTRTARR